MALNPSIILQGQAPQIQGPLDVAEKGLSVQRLALGNQAAQKEMDSQGQLRKLEMIGRLAGSVKDQSSLDSALSQARQFGFSNEDLSQVPNVYDSSTAPIFKTLAERALSVSDKYNVEQRMLDRKDARDERRALFGERQRERLDAKAEKLEEKKQGLKTPYGLANTEFDAKDLNSAHIAKRNFDSKIKELIGLRQKYGVEYMNRDVVARAKQLSKDLLLSYKEMAKLGVLSQADEAILNEIIPADPTGQDYAIGQDPVLTKLTKFKEDSDKDFNTRVETRTRAGIENTAKVGSDDKQQNILKALNQKSEDELDKLYKQFGGE